MIAETLEKASKAQAAWRATTITEREQICLLAIKKLQQHQDQIVEELTWQMGRPIRYCAGEINGFAERAESMILTAHEKLLPLQHPSPGFDRFIQRQPLGVVLNLVPWNYPYLTAVNLLVPALMAGNAVIMKPSSQTPLTAQRMAEAFQQAGLTDGVLQVLYLKHNQVEQLIKNPTIDYVAFTGSVSGGRAVEQAASGRFINVGLELGGKDAAYVRADADMQSSVENLVDGVFFNSGQSCCGIERIYVHTACYDQFVEKFVTLTNSYKLDNPLLPETTLGPMVSVKAADRVRAHIRQALDSGATALIDPAKFAKHSEQGAYLAPQVLVDVNHQMQVMQEESFGPVVGIMKVDSDHEAIEKINDSHYGLTASIWTQDEQAAIQIGEQLEVGTVFMNRCDYLDPQLAWTGLKDSGKGCTLSEIGYEALTRPKSFHLRR
jgi:acyl-CoA reductase-like NAD-dependent aldehyde dehydrogenase